MCSYNLLERLLNQGELETDVDFGDKYTVNLVLMLVMLVDLSLMLFFSLGRPDLLACFSYFISFVFSIWFFFVNRSKWLRWVRIATPFLVIVQIVFSCFFLLGSGSGLQWLLVMFSSYSFLSFQRNERAWQASTIVSSFLAFVLCELYAPRSGLLLDKSEQVVSVILVFVYSLLAFGLAVQALVGRLFRVNMKLRELAERDVLTGLPNRRKVLNEALAIFNEALESSSACSFAIIDFDHFKRVNDSYGHEAGDLVLQKGAEAMSICLRKHDKIGRYGGEEFVIIMPNTDGSEAMSKMELLRASIESLNIVSSHGIRIPVTVSIGVASMSKETAIFEDVLALADKALYKAKKAGRNKVFR
ncbi:putative diguanylate cyclase AdrA [Marinomonas spartinae]|uniref:GGDEF domain-containing protein n=1 Tax=Marinomonas spartinae TaxID=1792290 RepID=UPI000808D362|nr:GGDEF domain-containing protein [Marinomonas spartinae]SBS35482.1 putative diguanylate cyclase AdrA [Marinomonas spartinae]